MVERNFRVEVPKFINGKGVVEVWLESPDVWFTGRRATKDIEDNSEVEYKDGGGTSKVFLNEDDIMWLVEEGEEKV